MTESIPILVTSPVAERYPKFVARLAREHPVSMAAFDEAIIRVQQDRLRFSQALMLVNRQNLLLSSTWVSALHRLGATPPKLIVVQDAPSTALRVLAAHSGAAGVVDPLEDWSVVAKEINQALTENNDGLPNHPIWDEIEPPIDPFGTAISIKDDTDRDIVDLVALGLSDREVAAGVHLAEQTVRNRLSRVLESSGFKNRTQLAVIHRRHLESVALAAAIPWLKIDPDAHPEQR